MDEDSRLFAVKPLLTLGHKPFNNPNNVIPWGTKITELLCQNCASPIKVILSGHGIRNRYSIYCRYYLLLYILHGLEMRNIMSTFHIYYCISTVSYYWVSFVNLIYLHDFILLLWWSYTDSLITCVSTRTGPKDCGLCTFHLYFKIIPSI